MKKQQGFTLIELMIVVAIIAILAAIALPQYRQYTQKSANSACLAEAKAYMATAVANMANDEDPPTYTASACASRSALVKGDYASDSTITFTAKARGATELKQDTTCKAGSGQCSLAAVTTTQ